MKFSKEYTLFYYHRNLMKRLFNLFLDNVLDDKLYPKEFKKQMKDNQMSSLLNTIQKLNTLQPQKQHYTLPTGKKIDLSGSPEFVQDVKEMLDILAHSPTAVKILDHVALPIEEFKEGLDLGRNTGKSIQLTHRELKNGEKIQKYSWLTLIPHEFRHSYNAPKSDSHILNAMAYALVNEGDAQAIEGLVALELNEYIEKNKDKLSDAQAIQDCLAGDPKLQFFKKFYDEAKGSDGERKAHAMEMFVKKFAQHPIQGGKTFAELAYKSSLERNTTVGGGWERFSDEDTQKIEGCLLGKINPESIAHEPCMKGRKQLSDESKVIGKEMPTFCNRIMDGTFNTDVIQYGQDIKPISLIDTLSPQLAKHLREIGVTQDVSKYAGKKFEK